MALIGVTALSFGIGTPTFDIGPSGADLAVIGAATVAGTVAGALIGRRTQKVVSEGGRIDGVHGGAVIGGAMMAGGTLGGLASVPLIKGRGEGTPLGTDEQTFALLTLAGGALGIVYVLRNRQEFAYRNVSVSPAGVGSAGAGLQVMVRY